MHGVLTMYPGGHSRISFRLSQKQSSPQLYTDHPSCVDAAVAAVVVIVVELVVVVVVVLVVVVVVAGCNCGSMTKISAPLLGNT